MSGLGSVKIIRGAERCQHEIRGRRSRYLFVEHTFRQTTLVDANPLADAGAGTVILALAADLLFASRIRAAASAAGVDAVLFRSAEALLDAARARTPRRVLIDLDARGIDAPALIRALKADARTSASEVIAFVAHVNEPAIAAARIAGADRVLARSAFVRLLPSLLT